mgnify:CR=1 FL=1
MADLLKGNFEPAKAVEDEAKPDEDLESRFEREAMKRLGGSMAFVAKKKIAWSLDDDPESEK